MEIILIERIETGRQQAEMHTLKNGFARNYLLPNNKALRANDTNRKLFEANRGKIEADNAERRTEAEGRASGIDGKQIVLIRQASNTGQLYGSVSVRDIVDALAEDGITDIGKSMVALERPIKALGLVDVKVKLHPEVIVSIAVNVARSPDEAEMQKQGIDVIAAMFEEEQAEAVATALEPDSEDEFEDATPPSERAAEVSDDASDDEGDKD